MKNTIQLGQLPEEKESQPRNRLQSIWQTIILTMRTRLLLAFLVVALIPLGILAYLNLNTTQAALSDAANRSLVAAASQTTVRLDAFINNNLNVIGTEAQLPILVEYLNLPLEERAGSEAEARVADAMETFISRDPIFISSYALLDLNGQNVIDTLAGNVGQDESGRDYFEIALETGLPYVSSVKFSEVDDAAYLYFSSPVHDAAGVPVGVLRARYSAPVLQQLVIQDSGLVGPQSFAVLLDENYLFLAYGIVSHGGASELTFKTIEPLSPGRVAELQQAQRLPSGPFETMFTDLPALRQGLAQVGSPEPYFTTRLIGTGTGLQAGAVTQMETQPWLVAFFQPQEALMAPVQDQTRSTLALATVIFGLVVIMALGIAQLLARPITQLTTVAQQVASGSLKVQAPVDRKDEIGQLAMAFNSMTTRLRDLIGTLEQRVKERTQELARRSAYLEASAEVGRAATLILDTDELVREVVKLIRERFDLYYVGLLEVDATREWALLKAGASRTPGVMLPSNYRQRVGEGIIGWSIEHATARVAQVAEEDEIRLDVAELPDTRSEAALPLRSRGQVLGALSVQSDQPGTFEEQTVTALQTMADQVAVAIDNARLFAESQAALEAERRAYGELSQQAWTQLLGTRVDWGYYSDQLGTFKSTGEWQPEMEQAIQQERVIRSKDGAPTVAVPVRIRGRVMGALHFQKDQEDWTNQEIEMLETLTNQLSQTLESARLYHDTQRRAAQEQMVGEVAARMRETLDVDLVLQTAAREMRRVLNLAEAQVRLGSRPEIVKSSDQALDEIQAGDKQSPASDNGHE